MAQWLGASWETVGFVALSTVAMYASTVIALRVAGRRTLSEMSAFDFVITIALGSLVASTAVARDPSYLQGLTALVTFLLLQVAVAGLRQRTRLFARYVDFPPVVIYENDRLALRRAPWTGQMTEQEIMSKLRRKGVFQLDDVRLIILEPDGGVSVVRNSDRSGRPLEDVPIER